MLLSFSLCCHAQWMTQTNVVKPGWSAVYLHVDPLYQTLDQMVGYDVSNPISQVWLWQAPSSQMQFVTSPQSPNTGDSQWITWFRPSLGKPSALTTMIPNAAYLVYSTATNDYVWRIKGRPVAPSYTWDSAGLNFIGFPTPGATPPKFDRFLSYAQGLQGDIEVYQYRGGNLGPTNPSRVLAMISTPVARGQAFWMRSGSTYNKYYGAFEVALQGSDAVNFGTSASQYSLHLRNRTTNTVTITARMVVSETPPAGQRTIAGVPPLVVRGPMNLTNLTYGFSYIVGGRVKSWVLPPEGRPGSDVTVVLGLNRSSMMGNPGDFFAGILQFTDSLGVSEINVPVSGVAVSTAGLWVGAASVSQVRNYLKNYQRDSANAPVVATNGAYVVSSINTNFGAVPQAFPLRLIVHNDGTNSVLLQRVFYGVRRETNVVVATDESVLDTAHLDTARRITATHLPWTSTNTAWTLGGPLAQGVALTATAVCAYDDQAANPFLHTYHPDHDNLDANFKNQLAQGYESYQVTRRITLNVSAPSDDFTTLTSASENLSGTYLETITLSGIGGRSRSFDVSGNFTLTRISNIATLTRP